jgi:hypothetical protein
MNIRLLQSTHIAFVFFLRDGTRLAFVTTSDRCAACGPLGRPQH